MGLSVVERYLQELWSVLLDLSPALLAGLLLAGLLRVFLPDRLVRAHLSRPGVGSAVRAALIGVPMPLCSCGVVPTAMGLRNQGASRGATTSFLISTPQTGVDSVLVSASFLGWPFAIFKLAAAFVTGVVGGWLADRVEPQAGIADGDAEQGQAAASDHRLLAALRYALYDILAVIDIWLIVGILLAALITTLLPGGALAEVPWTQGLGGMLVVLAISVPLYVCTTASVPIAASLIAAGMPAGTALVFLMAGPATNIATIGVVFRVLGARQLFVYLGTVIVGSVALGMTFDFVLGNVAEGSHMAPGHAHDHGAWWEQASAIVLVGLLAYLVLRRFVPRHQGLPTAGTGLQLSVSGMTCAHCASSVKAALEELEEVDEAIVDLGSGIVQVRGGQLRHDVLADAIHRAGFRLADTPSASPGDAKAN